MKNIKVLGIDYSLNGSGLAVYDGKNIIFKKVFTMTKKDFDNNPDIFIYVPKMDNTMKKIDIVAEQILTCTDYDFVLMEDHIGRYYNWMDGYGVIKHLLRKNNKPYIMASPTTIKKYAGLGKADKKMMSKFLKLDYGFDFDDLGKLANNIVDASWMAIIGYNFYMAYVENSKDLYEAKTRLKILKTLADKNTILLNELKGEC